MTPTSIPPASLPAAATLPATVHAEGRSRRHSMALALVALATLLSALTVTSVDIASAAAYRYWSYWQGASGNWVSAQTGPGDHVLADSDVQGWRFGISGAAPIAPPGNAPNFATLCPSMASTPAPQGSVRVAVVIDFGLAADAPEGQIPPASQISCVTLPDGSNGNQALAAAATVDMKNSLICSVNGYPQGECAAELSDAVAASAAKAGATESPNLATPASPSPTAADSSVDDKPSAPGALGLSVAFAAVIAVAAAAVVVRRRRTS